MRPQSARRGRQDATAEQDARGEQSREHVYWKVKPGRLSQLHPTPRALSAPSLAASSTSLSHISGVPGQRPPLPTVILGWGPDARGGRPVLKVLCSASAGWGWAPRWTPVPQGRRGRGFHHSAADRGGGGGGVAAWEPATVVPPASACEARPLGALACSAQEREREAGGRAAGAQI